MFDECRRAGTRIAQAVPSLGVGSLASIAVEIPISGILDTLVSLGRARELDDGRFVAISLLMRAAADGNSASTGPLFRRYSNLSVRNQ